MIDLKEIGERGQIATQEVMDKYENWPEWLNDLVPGLGDLAMDYWGGDEMDPVQAFCAGLQTGLIIANEEPDA